MEWQRNSHSDSHSSLPRCATTAPPPREQVGLASDAALDPAAADAKEQHETYRSIEQLAEHGLVNLVPQLDPDFALVSLTAAGQSLDRRLCLKSEPQWFGRSG